MSQLTWSECVALKHLENDGKKNHESAGLRRPNAAGFTEPGNRVGIEATVEKGYLHGLNLGGGD